MRIKSFRLGDVLEFRPKSQRKAAEGLSVGTYPFFTSSQKQKKWINSADYEKESLILGTGGAANIHYAAGFSTTGHVSVLTSKREDVSLRYVYYFLSNNKQILEKGFKGGGLKNLSNNYIEKILIPFPVDANDEIDLVEQVRVVELLNGVEELKEKRGIADAKTQQIIPALFIKIFGDPDLNPMNWERVPLVELGSLDRGKSKHRPRNAPELYGGKYPFIQTGDVTNAGWRLFSSTQTYSEKGFEQSKLWPKNTLCITIAANIAKTTILDFESCFPDSVVGFIPNTESNADYVQGLFIFLQKRLEDMAPQAAQQNINLAILRELQVPKPPIELQNRFSEAVNEILTNIEKQTRSKKKMENMLSSLISQVFAEAR